MSAAAASPTPPRAVLLLKLDTLGDLVLLAPALRALREAWQETRLSVLVRDGYLELAPRLAPGVEWISTTIDPFVQGPAEVAGELTRLQQLVTSMAPDVIVAATSRRNWVEVALAAAAPAARRVALGTMGDDPFFGTQLRLQLGASAVGEFPETVGFPADEPDWQRNFRLIETLVGHPVPRVRPTLAADRAAPALGARASGPLQDMTGGTQPSPAASAGGTPALPSTAALEFLRTHNLEPRRFAVCAPAGFANVAIKTWPAENFSAAVRHLRERHGLPTLLIGQENERPHLDAVRDQAGGAVIWTGRKGELPTLAALIAEAALFVGNDTGALHLAAATDVPVVGVYGGGTWPRFVPAARRAVTVVQPLPCFGCNWQCVFGDAPCVKGITVADVTGAIDFALAQAGRDFAEIRRVEHLPAAVRDVMGRAAARYHELQADHLARQQQIEEKDQEIVALKAVCDEREKLIKTVHGHAHALTDMLNTLRSDHALLQQTVANLPADAAASARALNDQAVHIRNVESILRARELELAEVKASAANRAAGLHELEHAKHYARLLAEKETVIQSLRRGFAERESLIARLAAEATKPTEKLHKLAIAIGAFLREKCWRPFDEWLFRKVVEEYWMQIGVLRHYEPRPLRWDDRLLSWHGRPARDPADPQTTGETPAPRQTTGETLPPAETTGGGLPGPRQNHGEDPASAAGGGQTVHHGRDARATATPQPQIAIVTPSFGQEKFIERTLRSVLDQHYPKLLYAVQDGGSTDASPAIIEKYAPRLRHWETVKDKGQADAIHRGFSHLIPQLGPDDIMAWLNSDDLLAPGSLRFVAEYFVNHPEVDVLYGHRIIIDDDDRDIGRWIMPRHNPATLEWIDYVPQETMFWRKRAWDLAGGIDPSFQFALDWDLLARFQLAGCKVVRVPYFLGAFRVHAGQKTSHAIHTVGAEEMRRVRSRFHGEQQDEPANIDRHARHARFWGAVTARLLEVGIRW